MKAPSVQPLDFEKPLLMIEEKISELRVLSEEAQMDFESEILTLHRQAEDLRIQLYENLQPVQKLQIARHSQRPNLLEVIRAISPSTWFEMHGDRSGADDKAMLGGLIELDGRPVMIVGTQKGRGIKENLANNFGMPNPEGYRKALRLFYHAEKFKMPIITVIDTPGAYPGIEGEKHGIGQAIAFNIREMARLRVPILSLVIGEASSGGALGIGVADRIFMLEHAVYTVISPEGCASILWRSPEYASQAAAALKITAQDLLTFGIIDGIISEPFGGAHYEPDIVFQNIGDTLIQTLDELSRETGETLVRQRYEKFRQIGAFQEAVLAKKF